MKYNEINAQDIEWFRSKFPPERLLTGEAIGEDYCHDELYGAGRRPDLLVRAASAADISLVLRYANERRIPVTTRGSGTGLVGGALPVCGGILLETTLMNRILELDEENLTVTVEPGVLLMDLAAYVSERGFLYPPDPGEKSATIGGNISTNAGGMRAVKYGVTRDYVRGLTVVLPDGSLETLGGKVVKNSTGYSLKDLFVGSEGTLGVVAEAVLRLVPLPKKTVSLLLPFPDIESALSAVPALLREGATPTALEFFTRATVLFAEDYLGKRFPEKERDAYLLMTFDGMTPATVEADWQAAAEKAISLGALDAMLVDTEERREAVWSARGAFLEAIKASTTEIDECDVVVPRTEVARLIRFTHELERELGVRIPSFGHAGDGNLHIYVCRDQLPADRWEPVLREAFDRMYKLAFSLGGKVSGEHGVGYAKRGFMREQLGESQVELMRRVKAVFDPNSIMNPQKVCD